MNIKIHEVEIRDKLLKKSKNVWGPGYVRKLCSCKKENTEKIHFKTKVKNDGLMKKTIVDNWSEHWNREFFFRGPYFSFVAFEPCLDSNQKSSGALPTYRHPSPFSKLISKGDVIMERNG